MACKSLMAMALLLVMSGGAQAGEKVARWVDENGVTHFGDPQFAPPSRAEEIEIEAANGMDAPDTSVLGEKRRGQQFRMIKKAEKKNKRGWRGWRSRRGYSQGYRG